MTGPLATVITVTGPLAPAECAGAWFTHVHLLGGPVERVVSEDDPAALDLHLSDDAAAAAELRLIAAAGVGGVVEMSCLDFNRDLRGLRQLSLDTGVSIVATTGFRRGETARAAGYRADWQEMADRMRADVLVGEDGITCGVLKAGGGSSELSEYDRAAIRAAATIQTETGLPISTHTEAGRQAVAQLRELERWGADLSHVAVGHIDRETDRSVHRAVLETGASVLYDQIGKGKYGGIDYYVGLLNWLDGEGFAGQLLLSSDFGRRSYLQAYRGAPGLAYLKAEFRTAILDRGVRPELIDGALGPNAWNFFASRNQSSLVS